jgi:hypothetical protein
MYTPIALLTFSTEVVINVDELKKVDILDAFPTMEDDDDSEEEEEEEEEEKVGGKEGRVPVDIRRQTLFNGSMGDLGLIWSIVRVRGTPNVDSWPVRVMIISLVRYPSTTIFTY